VEDLVGALAVKHRGCREVDEVLLHEVSETAYLVGVEGLMKTANNHKVEAYAHKAEEEKAKEEEEGTVRMEVESQQGKKVTVVEEGKDTFEEAKVDGRKGRRLVEGHCPNNLDTVLSAAERFGPYCMAEEGRLVVHHGSEGAHDGDRPRHCRAQDRQPL
jgi:hypothetical protein